MTATDEQPTRNHGMDAAWKLLGERTLLRGYLVDVTNRWKYASIDLIELYRSTTDGAKFMGVATQRTDVGPVVGSERHIVSVWFSSDGDMYIERVNK